MAYCTSCGKQNPDNTKFCTGCGAPLKAPAPVQQTAKGSRITWYIAGGLLLTGLLTAGYFIYFHQSKKQGDEKKEATTVSRLKELVHTWNKAINSRDATGVTALYADELTYYQRRVRKEEAGATLNDFYEKNPEFIQEIKGEITVSQESQGVYICNFDKTMTINSKPVVYPSYLRFSASGNDWKITEEGDKITDYNVNKKKAAASGGNPVIEQFRINDIGTQFPVIRLHDQDKADNLNAYLVKETMDTDADYKDLGKSLRSAYDMGTTYDYTLQQASPEKILLTIKRADAYGGALHTYTSAFTLNLVSGVNTNVKSEDYSKMKE